ncbi:MAG: putative metal-binding motif-containing protein [Flavobacteriales bacterium]|nr:putative metal-binding motif-containing protein [Flavobacteriales bacterium]
MIDQDGDGYLSTNDCDDLTPTTNPGADEICDGIDNDCNGLVDDNLPLVYADSDGDGYGDPNALVMCATPGSVANNTDCNDTTDTAIHPNAAELIDGIDNDCDGEVDEVQCNDVDGDGTTDCQGDCNDNEPSVFPGAAELCGDGLDNDCNGTIDDQTTWYQDTDRDGFGNESNTLLACEQPIGYSPNPGHCDDADAGVYPLAGPGIGCSSCSAADRQYRGQLRRCMGPCRTGRGRVPWSLPEHRLELIERLPPAIPADRSILPAMRGGTRLLLVHLVF